MNTQHKFSPANKALLIKQLRVGNNELKEYPRGYGFSLDVTLYDDEAISIWIRSQAHPSIKVFSDKHSGSLYRVDRNFNKDFGTLTYKDLKEIAGELIEEWITAMERAEEQKESLEFSDNDALNELSISW